MLTRDPSSDTDMFPNVLVPTPLHNYTRQLFTAKGPQHGTFFTSSSAFLMDNLLNERRCSDPPSSPPPTARDNESPAGYPLVASPDYESSESPCPTDYRIRKSDCVSPDRADTPAAPDDQEHSNDSAARLRSRLELDTDSRTENHLESHERWTPKRG